MTSDRIDTDAIRHRWVGNRDVMGLCDEVDRLRALAAPVGLTEDEQATVMRIGEKHNWPGGYMQHDFAALLAIIDRLSAAPVDDRERVPEGWRVEWRSCSPLVCDNPEHKSTPVLVPVFPPADPEENPDD